MDAEQIRQALRARAGVRVGPHTAAYALRMVKERKPFSVMGAHARTGVATQLAVAPALLADAAPIQPLK